ncbi:MULTISPECIES: DeoR/GlpR family DNA-binding transcription regulator [unclassified Aureimonas]|uniref:DeoR/GlpR family DNA-binding transcription regulator n=1 Tax=unclassified Aureimonas TaxID=2615206 RepID=UPI0006FCB410|nr:MULTISPECIES: DeoR/GlpR family DNA-binding transcription regulator [unclassified Aureimonas]KQT64072.1 hypothetical protein ASG62_03395 [Aureimonas sp. Leaf427]KQT81264.1 hypothetical protein ASG54_00665 [Aureimonas sp. Leaf460]
MSYKRQFEIMQALREAGRYSISGLAERLGVSSETVRRSIKPLIESGQALRFHGGILDPGRVDEPPFRRRMKINREEKRAVAALAAGLVRDGDSLILDNGTTTAYLAEALAGHSRLVVVTNSAEIACRLAARNGNRVFMTGGELSGDNAAAFGPASLDFLRQFEVRFAFVSVGGITARGDLVDFHLFEAEFARVAMAQAKECWILADRSKFGRDAPVRICELGDVHGIVCEGDMPAEFDRRCREAEVRLVLPQRPDEALADEVTDGVGL